MYQNAQPAVYWRDQLMLWGPRVLLAILILIASRATAHCTALATKWVAIRIRIASRTRGPHSINWSRQ